MLVRFIFTSILKIGYVEVRISRSVSESSFDFLITGADCTREATSCRKKNVFLCKMLVKVLSCIHLPNFYWIPSLQGSVTLSGLKHNIKVGVLFVEAWLRGQGHFFLDGAVEDSATAEISRSQVSVCTLTRWRDVLVLFMHCILVHSFDTFFICVCVYVCTCVVLLLPRAIPFRIYSHRQRITVLRWSYYYLVMFYWFYSDTLLKGATIQPRDRKRGCASFLPPEVWRRLPRTAQEKSKGN